MWILTYWKYVALVLATAVIAYGAEQLHVSSLLMKHQEELAEQEANLKKSCKEAQEKTKNANETLQKDRDAIASRLSALKLQYPNANVHVAKSTNSSAVWKGYGAGDGIPVAALFEYAGACEEYRTQRIVLEKFIDDERQ